MNETDKNINKEKQSQLQELQIIEQNVQQLNLQKQIFQVELKETLDALEEVKKNKSKDEIYKIIGSIMIKQEKSEIEKELKEKHELIELRIKSIEKQEALMNEQSLKLREKVIKNIK